LIARAVARRPAISRDSDVLADGDERPSAKVGARAGLRPAVVTSRRHRARRPRRQALATPSDTALA
jgi:hypothetical protein